MRKVTNDDIKKYRPMVEKYMRDSVVKNWNEASLRKGEDEISLGNSGLTVADIRQYLFMEVVIALTKYNPEYRTKEGRSVKESTFVFKHLFNRTGQLMKKVTKKRMGYGIWTSSIHSVLGEIDRED